MQTYQVWPSHFVHSHGIVQFDVQILVHALQSAADLDFVLELHGNFMLDERLEKAAAFLLATAGSKRLPPVRGEKEAYLKNSMLAAVQRGREGREGVALQLSGTRTRRVRRGRD